MSEEAMHKAIALSERYLDGRGLLIKNAKDFESNGRLPRGGRSRSTPNTVLSIEAPKDPRKLFIGNLTFDTTEEKLEKLFSKFGKIESLRISCFEDSGRCKG